MTEKRLFKEMLYALGNLMIESENSNFYVQTFLSGTASQDVTNSFKATDYSFEFVKCPLLSNKSIIENFNYFAEKGGDKKKLWMCNTKFLQLLYDTGGLLRALETVLDKCFKRGRFFLKLQDKNFTLFDDIFHVVINTLVNKYKLDKFIMKNREASCQQLYHCIGAIPVQLDTKLDSECTVTVEDLKRDGFLILRNPGPNTYFIEMPFYFIYIYNIWLNTIPTTIHKMFQPESQMAWDTWEKFVANYEVFRNNILVELEKHKDGISLKEFYRGAIGKVSVLNIWVRLEKLELFMDLDGLVIVNGYSAPFADVFLLRKIIPESRNLLIAFQQKWYITSQKFTIDDAVKECNKNKNAYKDVKDDNLRKFLEEAHIVTVIFTSRPFKGNPKDLPDDCLIISKENFNQYFGPLFALRLTFDIINDLNINSAEPNQIANVIKGAEEVISKAIYENRPYKSATEVIEKVVEKNSTCRSYLEDIRTQLENCSYTPYSFLDNEQDSMILDDNVIEMDVNLQD
ncbi:11464_t:CDS:2 [Funneliformis geosporum]